MSPDTIISDLIRREGGYVDRPADRGGPTKFGITAKTLGRVRRLGRDATADEVRALTEPEAREIYRTVFLDEPRFSEIRDVRLRALLVDCGVHSGPGRAAMWLQRALGVSADGVVGPATLTAVAAAEPGRLYDRVLAQRLRHLGRLITDDRSQAEFAAGWMARCAEFLES